MNDFANRAHSNGPGPSGPVERLNLDEATWWKKNHVPISQPLNSPLTPLSFAFLNPDQRQVFTFPTTPLDGKNNNKEKTEKDSTNKKFESNPYSPSSSTGSSSCSFSGKKPLQVKDLVVVDDEALISSTNVYEPKAHVGWASFGKSIQSNDDKESSVPKGREIGKRKVYLVRQSKNDRSKPYQVMNPIISRNSKNPKSMNKFPLSKSKHMLRSLSKTKKDSSDSEEDEIVDVVGIDEDEEAMKMAQESGNPPDLPPQRPLASRFEMQRQRKGSPIDFEQLLSASEYKPQKTVKRESTSSKTSRSLSPPPHLEPEFTATINRSTSSPAEAIGKEEEPDMLVAESDIPRRMHSYEHNPAQLLKTKVSSSAIPILPLSKSIMERKKAAIEMTRNGVIKRVPAPKNTTKNLTVAPKNVQVPAYADKTSITLYSNLHKPSPQYGRDGARTCVRCRDRPAVDMSSFKFLEDSNVVAVRAHLCDQTRVMIARTAMFNREYARRLGDRAHGTVWQKPDEVTAQMTGFCSATVRRCIDIANLSIVPRCADRIGVSKNELSTLKTAFGEEKFCGQPMRTPHVLSHYYSMKAQAVAAAAATSRESIEPKDKTPEDLKREEEEKKHHPMSYPVASPPIRVSPTPLISTPTPTTAPKKTILRWSSIQAPRILRAPIKAPILQFPRTAVIPVLKAETKPEIINTHRRRGRPKKERNEEEIRPVRASRRLRMKRNPEVDEAVRETVDHLVDTVSKKT